MSDIIKDNDSLNELLLRTKELTDETIELINKQINSYLLIII